MVAKVPQILGTLTAELTKAIWVATVRQFTPAGTNRGRLTGGTVGTELHSDTSSPTMRQEVARTPFHFRASSLVSCFTQWSALASGHRAACKARDLRREHKCCSFNR